MASVKMIEDGAATAEVQSVYEDIKKTREIAYVPNIWKTLATHPPTLKRIWLGIKTVMAPGRLDPLTKEMIAVAVSATNNCDYCIRSHTATARKLGMDNEMLGELMAVVGMFNQTNRLANGYQIEVDEQYLKPE
ncbi:MAG: alkylhydroperoxidase [Chloroflexi bacterium]|nr:alkylhydroperoxidase [Chloroflexota bacterium]